MHGIKQGFAMKKFRYNDIGTEKIILEFKCKNCQTYIKTDSMIVPKLNLNSCKDEQLSYEHKCQCGTCYTIDLCKGLMVCNGMVHELDENVTEFSVHEISDVPYDRNTILCHTMLFYHRIEKIVKKINDFPLDEKKYIYSLLFSNLISILDSFIKIYTEPIVLSKSSYINNFMSAFNLHKGTLEENVQKIKKFYKEKTFQSIRCQRKLLEEVLNSNITWDDCLKRYIDIRNVLIHQNGIDENGYIHKIEESELLKALEAFQKHVSLISDSLIDIMCII